MSNPTQLLCDVIAVIYSGLFKILKILKYKIPKRVKLDKLSQS